MKDIKTNIIFAIVLFIVVTIILFGVDVFRAVDNEKHRERFYRLGYDFAKYMIIWIVLVLTFFYLFENRK